MNYQEICNLTSRGINSLNTSVELAQEWCNVFSDIEFKNTGLFWMLGRSIVTIHEGYVYLWRNINSRKYITRIALPNNWPNLEYSDMIAFCSSVIEEYNNNYNRFK